MPSLLPVDDEQDARQGADGNPGDQAAQEEQGQDDKAPLDHAGAGAPTAAGHVDQGGPHRSGARHASDQEGREVADPLSDKFPV